MERRFIKMIMIGYDFICENLNNHKRSAFYLFMLLSLTSFAQEWKLAKEEDGIKVYTRLPEASKLEELRATVRIKTSLSAFTALLKDVPGYKEWAYNCVESELVKVICDTVQCYYTHSDLPWPVSDRDLVFRSSLKQDPLTCVIKTNSYSVHDMMEEKDKIVRIKEGRTSWMATPQKGGVVDVEYFATIDPGGSIPAWLVNSTITYGPIYTLQRVRKLLEEGKYKDAEFSFIKELK